MEAKFLKDFLQYGNNQVLTNKQELKKKNNLVAVQLELRLTKI